MVLLAVISSDTLPALFTKIPAHINIMAGIWVSRFREVSANLVSGPLLGHLISYKESLLKKIVAWSFKFFIFF